MKLTTIQTDAIRASDISVLDFIDTYIKDMPENSILAISAKVISLCEGRIVRLDAVAKNELVRQESQYYLPPEFNPYGVMVSINRDILIASAGIDESNGDGNFILWPEDPQLSANMIREHLRTRFGYDVGVLITDSRITPMRRGTIGLGLTHSGFSALTDYVGTKDVFGNYDLKYTYASLIDGLAAAAVVVMGEGAERTPLVLIEELPFVVFQDRNPNLDELEMLRIPLEEDLYSEMLKAIPWDKYPGSKN
jgi:F420-0:gamma-glutamyl ligase